MVRINKVYTRSGDQGNTSLVGGEAVPKDHPRVVCYGSLDELNTLIGLARCHVLSQSSTPRREGLSRILLLIQQRLFDLGAELATPPGKDTRRGVKARDITWLEEVIDSMNAELKPLKSFILPGGNVVAGFLHQARAVCRRAERLVVGLEKQEAVGAQVIPYLNRLSDVLFVCARWVITWDGESETLWEPGLDYDDSWRW